MPNLEPSAVRILECTRSEWVQARAFEVPETEAEQSVTDLFTQYEEFGSEGLSLRYYDVLLLSYVSSECRSRVLAAFEPAPAVLKLLRMMDRDIRASGELRKPPATDPL